MSRSFGGYSPRSIGPRSVAKDPETAEQRPETCFAPQALFASMASTKISPFLGPKMDGRGGEGGGGRGLYLSVLIPQVFSDSHDRSILDLRIAICHTCSDRSILDLGMACGAQRVLVDLLNAALCPERV